MFYCLEYCTQDKCTVALAYSKVVSNRPIQLLVYPCDRRQMTSTSHFPTSIHTEACVSWEWSYSLVTSCITPSVILFLPVLWVDSIKRMTMPLYLKVNNKCGLSEPKWYFHLPAQVTLHVSHMVWVHLRDAKNPTQQWRVIRRTNRTRLLVKK